ncbi:hypothetical protein OF83DRAFT_1170283 [Amylostereum chailletii]|nr:hypothetical protein OF83DRAFT_1170283 [Amylostereum chailletii]
MISVPVPVTPESTTSSTPTPAVDNQHQPSAQPDIYIDSYISQVFTPEDAKKYVQNLSRYLSLDGNLVDNPVFRDSTNSFCLLHQSDDTVIDYPNPVNASLAYGTVVPQRIWLPKETRRHWTTINAPAMDLNPPLWFLKPDGSPGIPLPHIVPYPRSETWSDGVLKDPGKKIEINNCPSGAVLYVAWPGYEDWTGAAGSLKLKQAKGVSMSQLALNVGRELRKFVADHEHVPPTEHPEWALGTGRITADDILLVGLLHTSPGRWQPILQLNRHIISDCIRLESEDLFESEQLDRIAKLLDECCYTPPED